MSEDNSSVGGEFEREPVPDAALLGSGKFWGMYAGEHTAGTEFMIGPLFLAAGASLSDLLLGLLLGNLLAVLTWRFLVVPIALSKRMTLYYQLERIAGGSLVKFYNLANGLLFCFLAGAMVTVSASAVGVPFGITFDVPSAFLGLSNPSFTALVAVVGVVIAGVAAGGYETVARVANIAAPWMIAVFAACGIVSLAQMGATNATTLAEGRFWSDAISFVQQKNGPQSFGFWQIVVFAWLCNGAMHFGMADLSIFRFARSKASGWAPAIGMFLGHYMAWIAAALLLAALIKIRPELAIGGDGRVSANPGLLAYQSLGWAGILCVVIAGWTTANPTIYRAGLAFQGIAPSRSRTAMTLVAGAVATLAGAFPNLSAQLLDFVGTYGTVLGPMGAVIFVDFYLMKRFGLKDEYANRSGVSVNVAVMLSWLLPVAAGLYAIFARGVFAAYAVIPCWVCVRIPLRCAQQVHSERRPRIDVRLTLIPPSIHEQHRQSRLTDHARTRHRPLPALLHRSDRTRHGQVDVAGRNDRLVRRHADLDEPETADRCERGRDLTRRSTNRRAGRKPTTSRPSAPVDRVASLATLGRSPREAQVLRDRLVQVPAEQSARPFERMLDLMQDVVDTTGDTFDFAFDLRHRLFHLNQCPNP